MKRYVAGTTVIAMIALVWWVSSASRKATLRSAGESMNAIQAAATRGLTEWLTERRQDVARVAGDRETERLASLLLTGSASPVTTGPSELPEEIADELAGKIETTLRQIRGETVASIDLNASTKLPNRDLSFDRYLGWGLITIDGEIRAASDTALVGRQLDVPEDSLDRIRARATTVSRPFRGPPRSTSVPRESRSPLMCAMAPLADGGRSLGSLVLFLDPAAGFAQSLATGRWGETGDSYALDQGGQLLTPSRFESAVRPSQPLGEATEADSPLSVRITDPVVEASGANGAATSPSRRPLTVMAEEVTRGAKGQNVEGYRDYRGVQVIGVWRWLPEYGIGVATELSVEEALAPLRRITRAALSLLGLAMIGIACAGWYRWRWQRRGVTDPSLPEGLIRQLGPYELIELIDRGGMGSVYRGIHRTLNRDVAIKVLQGADASPQAVERFQREVQSTARLRHPNTIAIHDFGTAADGTLYYVMEYVDGVTIHDLVEDYGRQPPARVIHLLLQVCGSLSEAHQQGMIHRDIKPANILLTATAGLYDMIKVLDFGLVKQIDRETMELTQSDGITGTPMYMSPESVRDAATADQRSDLYSIGAVGYTLLTGKPTFDGDATIDICLKQLNEEPRRPSERVGMDFAEDLQNVLMSCLRKEPDERPRSAADLSEALRQCADAYGWSEADARRWWDETAKADARPQTPAAEMAERSPRKAPPSTVR